MEEQKKTTSLWKQLAPMLHLWPAALTLILMMVTLPLTRPVLSALPEKLPVPASAEEEPATEPELEEEQLAAVLEANYEDGVYTGSAQGYGGLITVQVTVEGGQIVSVEILRADGETTSFFNRAMGVVELVLTQQTWEVDTISGATYSSRGILGAIQTALTGEQVENEEPEKEEPVTALVEDTYEAPQNGYQDGTYTGTATGFGGDITVEVVIKNGKIASIRTISAAGETKSYWNKATAVIDRVVAANSPNVDTVSGATYSSTGILNAVKRALAQAAVGETEDLTVEELPAQSQETTTPEASKQPPEEQIPIETPKNGYQDGTYTGTATGFGGDITVEVVIKNGKIASIRTISAAGETKSYWNKATAVIDRAVAANSPNVDTVSGATYSSTGILNAVKRALAQAAVGETEDLTVEELPTEKEEETPPDASEQPSEQPGESPEPSEPEEDVTDPAVPGETESVVYQDGVYTASVLCTDDEVFSYQLHVTITVLEGKITGVAVEKGEDTSDDPERNDTFLTYAIEGRTRRNVWYEGVVSQIAQKQSAQEIDVVSGATYSSRAIAEAAQQALDSIQEEETE